MKALNIFTEIILTAVALVCVVVLFGEPVEGSVLDNALIIVLSKLASLAVLILIGSRLAEKVNV